jgi:rubrerythrin
MVRELGSANCALVCTGDEHRDIANHWACAKIQAKEDRAQTVDRFNWEETQIDRDFDMLERQEHEQVDMQQAMLRVQIESLETHIEAIAVDADRQLFCFCASKIPGAWGQHYMCKTCYNAWKRQGPDKTCPFCRDVMKDPPACMTWKPA